MPLMKTAGECETFEKAFGLSFPQADVPGATTLTECRIPWSTSQQRASNSW